MKAVITISSVQKVPEIDADTIELVTDGVFCRYDSSYELHYQESELTGLEGTATTVRILPDCIIVERNGSVTSSIRFKQGERYSFLYDTPFGAATLGVDTVRVYADVGDSGGEICIDYVLNMEHAVVTENKLIIKIKPVEDQLCQT